MQFYDIQYSVTYKMNTITLLHNNYYFKITVIKQILKILIGFAAKELSNFNN